MMDALAAMPPRWQGLPCKSSQFKILNAGSSLLMVSPLKFNRLSLFQFQLWLAIQFLFHPLCLWVWHLWSQYSQEWLLQSRLVPLK
ncbi:MAG: hypothetical protein ACK56F_13875 [bacterium]